MIILNPNYFPKRFFMERRFSIYLFRGISYYCHLVSCLIELMRFSTSQLEISHFALILDTPLNIHFLIYL
jgi:hypothetical protein